jgi:hypothetical protein
LLRTLFSEYFSKNGGIAWVLEFKIDRVADVIEKCFEAGVTVSFSGLIVAFGEPSQKGKNLIWGDGFQISFTKFVVKTGKQKIIIFQRIFFSN